MEEIFKINMNDESLEIRAFNITRKDILYEVCKNGKLQFTLEHQINKEGNESWVLFGSKKAAGINLDLVNKIGDAIANYYK